MFKSEVTRGSTEFLIQVACLSYHVELIIYNLLFIFN